MTYRMDRLSVSSCTCEVTYIISDNWNILVSITFGESDKQEFFASLILAITYLQSDHMRL